MLIAIKKTAPHRISVSFQMIIDAPLSIMAFMMMINHLAG
jgi:hypothetical protein